MIVELVTFKAPAGADWDTILAAARATVPHWSANRQLVRKHYLLSDDAQNAPGSISGRRAPQRRPLMMRRGAQPSRSAPVRRR